MKVIKILKDNRALTYAPFILMGTVLIGVIILQFFTLTITKGNAINLKQEILNETSYLNSALADVIYDDISSGTYSDFKSIINGTGVENAIKDWVNNNLRQKLRITIGEPETNSRVCCSNIDVKIKSIDENTNTVTYGIYLYDTKFRTDVSSEFHDLGSIIIYGSYTYNGDKDVDDNEGNVAFDNDKYGMTEPVTDNVGGKLPDIPENPDINLVQ